MGEVEIGGNCINSEECDQELECIDNKCIQYVGIGEICHDNLISGEGECDNLYGSMVGDDGTDHYECIKYAANGEECDNMNLGGHVICEGINDCEYDESSNLGGRCEIRWDAIFLGGVFIISLLIYLRIFYKSINKLFIKIINRVWSFVTGWFVANHPTVDGVRIPVGVTGRVRQGIVD